MTRYPYRDKRSALKSNPANKTVPAKPEEQPELLPIQRTMLQNCKLKMKVRLDGKDQEITVAEAVIKKRQQTALGGSTHAQNQLLRDLKEAQAIEQRNIAEEVAAGHELKRAAKRVLELVGNENKKLKKYLAPVDKPDSQIF